MIEPLSGQKLADLVAGLLEQSDESNSNETSKLESLMRLFDSEEASAEYDSISFPAFKSEKALKLRKSLEAIGLGDMFDSERAQFSQIASLSTA